MERPFSGSQAAGRQSRRCSAERSPSPHKGQPPAGRVACAQRSAQALGPGSPPRPTASVAQAAPSAATASHGK
eukprot:1275804-Alexandrium_andersonii.AAC.1